MFTSVDSENNAVSSHISMPDISESIGNEENRLLQNEVDSLTHDLHAISARLQTTQEGNGFLLGLFLIIIYIYIFFGGGFGKKIIESACLHG